MFRCASLYELLAQFVCIRFNLRTQGKISAHLSNLSCQAPDVGSAFYIVNTPFLSVKFAAHEDKLVHFGCGAGFERSQILTGFNVVLPQKITLLQIAVKFEKLLTKQVVAAARAFSPIGFSQQGTVMVIKGHKAAHTLVTNRVKWRVERPVATADQKLRRHPSLGLLVKLFLILLPLLPGHLLKLPIILADSSFFILRTQLFQADAFGAARWNNGSVFVIWRSIDLIAHILQFTKKSFVTRCNKECPVCICLYQRPDGGLPLLCPFPIPIRKPMPIGFNDRELEFTAQFIGNLADSLIVTFEIISEHVAIRKADRIEYNMAMKMLLIQMSADGAFKSLCKKTAGKFTADLKALFWRHLFGGETLNNVIAEHTTVFRFLPSALGGLHGRKSSGRITVESGHIQLIFGFFIVSGVAQKALKVFGLNDFGFLWIGGIG